MKKSNDQPIYLNADDSLNYGYIVDILSILNNSGANALALTVEAKEE